ncbi:hypothetical protein MUBE_03965 [Mycobacterium uberis]|uniref:ATP/GTP-binding protein n=1 Tax=Mycobacterium uberis TaxID=2162698 RepID=A0A3E1HJ80_9MYCO|nr:hypothetical protein [Mycobacterium uberis]RFD26543.1 hypothetical protein MUBE_03965 [Mycobacterium uberis]
MTQHRTSPRRQRPLSLSWVLRRVEVGSDGREYEVRPIAAVRAVKIYRCPGCDHEIRSGTMHVVVWPADSPQAGAEDRRHWHTLCWAHRATRGPTRKWS